LVLWRVRLLFPVLVPLLVVLVVRWLRLCFSCLVQTLSVKLKKATDISRGRALAAAVPGAALEVASTFIPLGRTVVGKILGPKAEAALATGSKNNAKLVEAGLLRTLGTGTVVGAGLEVPTEVIQQMLERAQAGLDLTSDDALAEYGEAAYGAALVGGPFGAAGRVGQRSIARSEAEQKALAEQAAEEAKTAEETRLAKEAEEAAKEAEEAEKATPGVPSKN
jgi:hypothetical protein